MEMWDDMRLAGEVDSSTNKEAAISVASQAPPDWVVSPTRHEEQVYQYTNQ